MHLKDVIRGDSRTTAASVKATAVAHILVVPEVHTSTSLGSAQRLDRAPEHGLIIPNRSPLRSRSMCR